MEERVYCRYVEEHSQRQGYLVESREDMTRLNWTIWERGRRMERGKKRISCSNQEEEVQKGLVTKMSGLYKNSCWGWAAQPWSGEFSVEGRVCQSYHAIGRD